MIEFATRALLPAGLRDVLPPDAGFEAGVAEHLLAGFAGHGYERVKPPLVEFEDSLLAGAGAAMAGAIFRLMDPASQRMMGVRADITPQIARIAATRLAGAPRPLRLSYSGEVLCLAGSQLRPEREFVQVGAELIGSESPAADVEVVVLAAEALAGVGVSRLSIDLTLPTLVPSVCEGIGLDAAAARSMRAALDRKDAAAVAAVGGRGGELLGAMLRAAGPHERALDALARLDLPPAAEAQRDRLGEVAGIVAAAAPDLGLTIDPVEHRGFEYQTGVSFTLFAPGVRGELGRGGRYHLGDGDGEPATGFTLFMDTVLRALPAPTPARRLFLPAGVARDEAARLRAEGWVAVAGLDAAADATAEARRMGCSHVLVDGEIVALEG
ncbi:MAG: ATP phosphoribosyltransferase regulatory subunit [Alphaproteobacteria bacterium]